MSKELLDETSVQFEECKIDLRQDPYEGHYEGMGLDLLQYMTAIQRFPLLTAEQEVELAVKAKNGDKKAFDRLVNSNLKLVVHVAKKYNYNSVDIMDMIQAGNVGLVYAAQHFDPSLGYKFSTYAMHWIKRECYKHAAEMKNCFRLPLHTIPALKKVKDAALELDIENLHNITAGDLKRLSEKTEMEPNKILELIRLNSFTVSFEAINDDDDERAFEETIADTSLMEHDEELERRDNVEEIKRCMSVLSEKERFVISKRFGLDGEPPMTLEQVGKLLNGASREWPRILENRAIKKIKKEMERKPFRPIKKVNAD